jgi:epoxyqueuosine reductase
VREDVIAAEARAIGFTLVGAAPLAPLPLGPFFAGWLAEGRAGEMAYLARRPEVRLDPRRAMHWARTVIALAYPYRPPPPPPGDWRATLRGRIAAYALGTDYHQRVGALLVALGGRLGAALPGACFRHYVDTGPVLEREWATRAALGWIGRHTLLLHRTAGSYFFLAALFTDLALDPVPLPADHCGTCTRCIAACPTAAIEPRGYTMDPRRCISYLTIEHRGPIPCALRPRLENWIFGCDLCQDACPWNRDAHDTAGADELTPHLPTLLALDAAAFRTRFGATAVARAKRRGLLRNVAVVLGNTGNPDAVPPLARTLAREPEPLVRARRLVPGLRPEPRPQAARRADPDRAPEVDAALDNSRHATRRAGAERRHKPIGAVGRPKAALDGAESSGTAPRAHAARPAKPLPPGATSGCAQAGSIPSATSSRSRTMAAVRSRAAGSSPT